MTVHDLHDALTQLPVDLITAADKVRTPPKTPVFCWRRWVSLAAVLALVLGTSLVFAKELLPRMGSGTKESATAEAPAAMAPESESQKTTADTAQPELPFDIGIPEIPAEEAQPEPPSDVGMPEIPYGEAAGSKNGMQEELSIDHSHSFAEESDRAVNSPNYCGNMLTTVYLDEMNFTLAGSDSVTLTDILVNLDYDPDLVCRCMAEFTVDTELLAGIHVNLTEGFARCERGQAALTEAQARVLQNIIDGLQ